MKRTKRFSAAPNSEDNKNVVTSYRWGWYGLSFFVPLSGILIGLFLYDQDSRDVRKVGRNCLFIGFLVWVVFPLLVAMAVAFFLALAAIGAIADMMPTD
jgi:single-stranded DNA-specific DHH superfamily exonuclease